jgi:hypothetical protein
MARSPYLSRLVGQLRMEVSSTIDEGSVQKSAFLFGLASRDSICRMRRQTLALVLVGPARVLHESLGLLLSSHARLLIRVGPRLIFRERRRKPFPARRVAAAEDSSAVTRASHAEDLAMRVIEGEQRARPRQSWSEDFGGESFARVHGQFLDAVKADFVVELHKGRFEGSIDGCRRRKWRCGVCNGSFVRAIQFPRDEGDKELPEFGRGRPTGVAIVDAPEHLRHCLELRLSSRRDHPRWDRCWVV